MGQKRKLKKNLTLIDDSIAKLGSIMPLFARLEVLSDELSDFDEFDNAIRTHARDVRRHIEDFMECLEDVGCAVEFELHDD